ncbi:hypothetical protein DSECCO2_432860 [anaerobic digester metagenome]
MPSRHPDDFLELVDSLALFKDLEHLRTAALHADIDALASGTGHEFDDTGIVDAVGSCFARPLDGQIPGQHAFTEVDGALLVQREVVFTKIGRSQPVVLNHHFDVGQNAFGGHEAIGLAPDTLHGAEGA